MAESLIRLRGTSTTDGYGDAETDWTTPTRATLPTRGVEPVSSTEDNDGRQAVITGYRVYLEAGTDLLPTDRAILRGQTCEVMGLPADWRSPHGSSLGGLVAALRVVTG